MFDFRVSKHPHFDEACRGFAKRHDITALAKLANIKPQTLRNKLTPDQPHQLTPREIWAQIHCLPCVPVNELASEKLQSYVMRAMGDLGELATGAVSSERLTPARRLNMVERVNSGIRMLSLSALAIHARIQANPAMSSTVDTMTGLGASFGLM